MTELHISPFQWILHPFFCKGYQMFQRPNVILCFDLKTLVCAPQNDSYLGCCGTQSSGRFLLLLWIAEILLDLL